MVCQDLSPYTCMTLLVGVCGYSTHAKTGPCVFHSDTLALGLVSKMTVPKNCASSGMRIAASSNRFSLLYLFPAVIRVAQEIYAASFSEDGHSSKRQCCCF